MVGENIVGEVYLEGKNFFGEAYLVGKNFVSEASLVVERIHILGNYKGRVETISSLGTHWRVNRQSASTGQPTSMPHDMDGALSFRKWSSQCWSGRSSAAACI